MKTFFGGVFINEKLLKDSGINHPIKLEYYKRINEGKILELYKVKYGLSILKTEYKKEGINTEEKRIDFLTNDENSINEMLKKLKENYVTPIRIRGCYM